MKVVIAARNALYQIVGAVLEGMQTNICEVGVLAGENAKVLYGILKPRRMYLVDSWSPSVFSDFRMNNSHRPWVKDLGSFGAYFGGPPDDPETFERLYKATSQTFNGFDNVWIIRANSRSGAAEVRSHLEGEKLHFVYIDASHQYETVFDDLVVYSDLLDANGFIQMNDCAFSAAGVEQNLGVLEAAVRFCKFAGFVPLLMTNTDWTDILLCRRDSVVAELVDRCVLSNEVRYVELPWQLLGAARVRIGSSMANLSFV